jgi:hypothetical protein
MIFECDFGHAVLLHLLQDNILERIKFQGSVGSVRSHRMSRDLLQQQFADPLRRLIGGEVTDAR